MTPKRILFAVMCTLLVLVMVMTGIVIHVISALFQNNPVVVSPTEGSVNASSEAAKEPTEASSAPTEAPDPTEPPHEHAYTTLVKKVGASCNTLGYTEYACSCGKVRLDDYVDPLGHAYAADKVIAPTCTETGYTIYKCSRCSDVDMGGETAALGHEYDNGTEVSATCMEGSHIAYTCLREGCGDVKKENIQEDIADHSFGPWIPTASGEYMRICTVCGRMDTENEPTGSIAPLKITDAQFSDVTEEDATYRLYVITVGTDDFPAALSYSIFDYRNNGTVTYEYNTAQGLIVTYMDGETPITVILQPQMTDPYIIPATIG